MPQRSTSCVGNVRIAWPPCLLLPTAHCGWVASSGNTVALHTGQVQPAPCCRSHGRMQSLWNWCLQGSVSTCAPGGTLSKHTVHTSSSSSAQPEPACAVRQAAVSDRVPCCVCKACAGETAPACNRLLGSLPKLTQNPARKSHRSHSASSRGLLSLPMISTTAPSTWLLHSQGWRYLLLPCYHVQGGRACRSPPAVQPAAPLAQAPGAPCGPGPHPT